MSAAGIPPVARPAGDGRAVLRHLARIVIALASILALVGIAILPFLTPAWLGLAQDRAQATAWTGWSRAEVRAATDAIVHDLVIGPPAFDVAVGGTPILDEREREHMRDVRGVFASVFLLAAVAGVLLAVTWRVSHGGPLVRDGIVAGGVVVVGAIAVLGAVFGLAFDAAWELFHRLFFPPGSYSFDSGTSRLVQLLPGQLWYETSLAFGALLAFLAVGAAWLARRGARGSGRGQLEARDAAGSGA